LIQAFLVDDSGVSRHALRTALSSDPEIRIVGEASSGEEALDGIPTAFPDVVLMDIVMPGLDGLEATRQLMRICPKPVLIISAQIGGRADRSFEALRAGALDVIGKPLATELLDPAFVKSLCRKVKLLAEIPVVTRHRGYGTSRVVRQRRRKSERPQIDNAELVCIGSSTGGPPALQRILAALPAQPAWPIVIVQHMAPGFIGGMVSWMQRATGREVELARSGTRPVPGAVYVADDHKHLELVGKQLKVSDVDPVGGHRPSVDVLFASIASTGPAEATVGMVLTGMGKDGAEGLRLLREAGAWTIAQDEKSSVVYGMPKAAIDNDAACEVLSLDEITAYLANPA
jgi:two-component system chemotaxis response regulator CheB